MILIGGMSRAGKSRLAKELSVLIPNSVHIDQDDYVRPAKELSMINGRINWELPTTIDWDLLIKDIQRFSSNSDIVIVEGIFAFANPQLNSLGQTKIYLEVTKKDFFDRRTNETRWGEEPKWYLNHVWEAHQQWKNPEQLNFDIVTPYHKQLASQVLSLLK